MRGVDGPGSGPGPAADLAAGTTGQRVRRGRALVHSGRRAQTPLTRAGAAATAAASRIPATSSMKSASSRTLSTARASTV